MTKSRDLIEKEKQRLKQKQLKKEQEEVLKKKSGEQGEGSRVFGKKGRTPSFLQQGGSALGEIKEEDEESQTPKPGSGNTSTGGK